MKRLILILLLIISFKLGLSQPAGYDQVIATYTGRYALIKATTSDFDSNRFSVILDIKWVNKKLHPVSPKKDILAVDLRHITISPENSLVLITGGEISAASQTHIRVVFGVNPQFQGGNVSFIIPLLCATTAENGIRQKWQPVLFAQPHQLKITKYIDPEKIQDVFPPEIDILYPLVNKKINPDFPVVNNRMVQIHISVSDKSGVKQVLINHRPAKMIFPGQYDQSVVLATGLNTVRIEATDNLGNTATKDYDILCTYQYDIDTKGGRFYALLIAENDYKDNNIPDLNNPVKDAKKLYDVLVNDYTFKPDDIFFLKNPTRSQIINTLDQLSSTLTDKDNLLIFYAGHGYWDEYKQIGYWLPSDANINDKSTWLRNSTIKDYIGAINTLHTLLITDACFSGSIFKTRAVTEANAVVAYQKIYQLPSRKAMTSGTLKEVPDKSIFLQSLVLQLKANNKKYLPASELFDRVRVAVLNNTPNVPQFGTIQNVGDQGGEFIFIHK